MVNLLRRPLCGRLLRKLVRALTNANDIQNSYLSKASARPIFKTLNRNFISLYNLELYKLSTIYFKSRYLLKKIIIIIQENINAKKCPISLF